MCVRAREAVYASCFAAVQRVTGDMERLVAEHSTELKVSVSLCVLVLVCVRI